MYSVNTRYISMYLDLCNKLGAKFYFSKNAPHPSYLLAIFVVDLMMHFEFSKYLDKLQILPPFKKLTRAGQTLANALFSPLYNIDHPKVPLIKSYKGDLFMNQNLRLGVVWARNLWFLFPLVLSLSSQMKTSLFE